MDVKQTGQFVADVHANGGATRSTHGERLPTRGYFVSDNGGEIIALHAFGVPAVRKFIHENLFALSQAGVYVGAWVNDDKVYLDITRHYHNRVSALNEAAKQNQLAIWDISNDKEIAA